MADLGNVLGASGLCPAYVEQCLTADTNLVSAVFSGGGEGAPAHRCSRHGRARHQISACFLGLDCLLADLMPKATPYTGASWASPTGAANSGPSTRRNQEQCIFGIKTLMNPNPKTELFYLQDVQFSFDTLKVDSASSSATKQLTVP